MPRRSRCSRGSRGSTVRLQPRAWRSVGASRRDRRRSVELLVHDLGGHHDDVRATRSRHRYDQRAALLCQFPARRRNIDRSVAAPMAPEGARPGVPVTTFAPRQCFVDATQFSEIQRGTERQRAPLHVAVAPWVVVRRGCQCLARGHEYRHCVGDATGIAQDPRAKARDARLRHRGHVQGCRRQRREPRQTRQCLVVSLQRQQQPCLRLQARGRVAQGSPSPCSAAVRTTRLRSPRDHRCRAGCHDGARGIAAAPSPTHVAGGTDGEIGVAQRLGVLATGCVQLGQVKMQRPVAAVLYDHTVASAARAGAGRAGVRPVQTCARACTPLLEVGLPAYRLGRGLRSAASAWSSRLPLASHVSS